MGYVDQTSQRLMVGNLGVKLSPALSITKGKKTMSEQKSPQERYATFINKIRAQFNKNAAHLQAADGRLEAQDYEGFLAHYAGLDKETLLEIVQAQHIKVNETYGLMLERQKNLEVILQDIAHCQDFVAFGKLKEKAQTILMAQQLQRRGMSDEEIVKALNTSNEGGKIIIQQ